MNKRYKLNVPGDFYVEDGCCVACTLPVSEAPNLIGEDETNGGYHCYFKKQPTTPEEVNEAIFALEVSCVGCIRYGGDNSEIIEKIVASGSAAQIDKRKNSTFSEDGEVKNSIWSKLRSIIFG